MPSCCECNRFGHKAAECKNTVCFNCDGLGHVAKECVRPMYCCICKSGQHLACTCPLSWCRPGAGDSPQQQAEEHGASGGHDSSAEHTPRADDHDGTDRADGANSDVVLLSSDNEDLVNAVAEVHLLVDDLNFSEETDSGSQLVDSLADYATPLSPNLLSGSVVSEAEVSNASARATRDTLTIADKSPSVTLNNEGLIVGSTMSTGEENIQNLPSLCSSSSTDKSWAEVVDHTSPPIVPVLRVVTGSDVPGPSARKPQRAGSSRSKPAPAPATL